MTIETFESGLLHGVQRKSILYSFVLVLVGACSTGSAPGQEGGGATLSLMPLPRSVQRGTGSLNLSAHFNAGFTGTHDARLDAGLDRFLVRLDRQCGEIRRSQYASRDAAAAVLTLKAAGPGGAVQSVEEDESYQLQITTSQATLSAATDVGAMHGMETFLQLVRLGNDAGTVPVVTVDDAPRFPW